MNRHPCPLPGSSRPPARRSPGFNQLSVYCVQFNQKLLLRRNQRGQPASRNHTITFSQGLFAFGSQLRLLPLPFPFGCCFLLAEQLSIGTPTFRCLKQRGRGSALQSGDWSYEGHCAWSYT